MIVSSSATCVSNVCQSDGTISIAASSSCGTNMKFVLKTALGAFIQDSGSFSSTNYHTFTGKSEGVYLVEIQYGNESNPCFLREYVKVECECCACPPGQVDVTVNYPNFGCVFTKCYEFSGDGSTRNIEVSINNSGQCACDGTINKGDVFVWVRQVSNVSPSPLVSYTQEFVYPDIYVDIINCNAYIWFLEPPQSGVNFRICVMRAVI